MAHPASKEVAHRQQFYFWKNYRNNRLKHILPRPLPETETGTLVPAPPPPVPTGTAPPASAPSPAAPVPSPLPYGIPPGSGLAKNDPRNTTTDRRKRKKDW